MYLHNMGIGVNENDATWTYLLYRPAPNVLEKLPIFLCFNSSTSYLFFLLAVPILPIAAHALAKTKCKLLRDRVSRLGIQKYVRFPHGDRMPSFVFLRVPSTLGLQSAKSGCYTGTSIATFHSVLPCRARVVTI